MSLARTIGIWISGLLGSAMAGYSLVRLTGHYDTGEGMFAGALLFTCTRLWAGEKNR